MCTDLLTDIEEFLRSEGIGEHRFGMLAVKNGRLVERLREGRRVWPDTEDRIRKFMKSRRPEKESATSEVTGIPPHELRPDIFGPLQKEGAA